jgi:hypothetical protein
MPKPSYFFVIAKEPFRRLKQSHTQYVRLLRRKEHPPRNDGNEIKIVNQKSEIINWRSTF